MIVNGDFTFVMMIIFHILRTNSIVFMVLCTLLSLYYQIKLTCLSGRRPTVK